MLFSLAGVATARYFMAKLSVLPPKPVFENDAPAIASPDTNPAASTPTVPEVAAPAPEEPEPAVDLPPGSYEAVVNQPVGLVLRSGPGTEFDRLGGLDNNTALVVLKTSDDGEWLNVRIPSTGQEGWVKGGNTRRTDTAAQ
ncbi:MAG: SH3 domain-containing protein [Leptolyngbya sp.]|nr:SH3 domain-containing protein [Leptolyngbya sp.]